MNIDCVSDWLCSVENDASELKLDDIWTAGYYGDEGTLENAALEEKWIIFSKDDGTLILKKGLNGETYPIIDQYKVTIENVTYKGQLLSELMRDLVKVCQTVFQVSSTDFLHSRRQAPKKPANEQVPP